ncbi:endonuclease domain-containing protein [Gordonia sp. CPCC 205333]|uniref:endonuclease domain-containing protein n=1 Tax=Gordonia sp. CPCC 205333 TaxID=3140790 RepID=UPI003AF3B5A2
MGRDTGVYTTAELHAFGASTADIKRAAKDKMIFNCRRGWWHVGDAVPLAVEVVKAGGVVSCLSAIQFYKQTLHPKLYLPAEPEVHHGRLSRYGKSVVDAPAIAWCQGHGPPLPLQGAVDSLAIALGCAVRCLPPEEWIATCDSALHYTPLTKAALRTQLGNVSRTVDKLLDKCDSRAMSGPESIVRVRLRALGFDVRVQPSIGGNEHADLRIGSLLIECDSNDYHLAEHQKLVDCRRDRMTLKKGMMTIRIMASEVAHDWPSVLADIRAITDRDRHRRPYRPYAAV